MKAPALSNVIVSNEKEEKVVNPPNRPTNKKTRTLVEKPKAPASDQQKPIKKEPTTFTHKIPEGKE